MSIWLSARFRLVIVWLYTAMTFVLSSISKPPERLPDMFSISGFDLILHFIEYGILAYMIMKYFEVSEKRLSIFNRALIAVLFCGVMGGLNELWQIRVPNRTFSLADEIVNIFGALVVVLTYRLHQLYRFSKNNSQ